MNGRRSRKQRRGPEGIGDILKGVVGPDAKRRGRAIERARRKWAEVAGADIAARTSVMGLRGGVLRVRVDSTVLLAELDGIYKSELMAALAEGEETVAVRTIRFQLGGARESGA